MDAYNSAIDIRHAWGSQSGRLTLLESGHCRFLDGQYTAFGALSDGDDTLGAIGATPVGPSNSGENSKPKERVEVTSIRVA